MVRFATHTRSFVLAFAIPLSAAAQALQAPPISATRPVAPVPLPHPVLDRIRAANSFACGVSKEEEDYSRAEDHGNRAAFDVDLCKAVGIAVLGPGAHVVIKSYPDEPNATVALAAGQIDMLATASPSVTNTAHDLVFGPVVFHDGQGMLVPSNPMVHTPLDLTGKRVCFLTGSDAEDGLHSYAAAHGIRYIWYAFSEAGEMEAAFFTGNCDAITGDVSQLANIRAINPRRAGEFTILPQLIRQDPLAPATYGADLRFAATVRWTIETLIAAERLGVTRANFASMASSANAEPQAHPELRALLGQRYGTGTSLGLDPHWGAAVIAAMGNYGELFEHDLGAKSPLRIERGEDRLPSDGGLLYGVPVTER